MRKLNFGKSFISFLLGLMLLVSTSSSSLAFINLFPAPGMPVIDPGLISGAASQVISSTANEVTNIKAFFEDQINKLKKSIMKVMSSIFKGKAKKDSITAVKTIANSSIANEKSEASVQKAIYTLFFIYPSNDVMEMREYEDKAKSFYDDTVIEAYAAVRELEKQISSIEQQIEITETSLVDGGDGACEATDENCAWSNNYKANQSLESLTFLVQELTAIRAQLKSAKAIRDTVKPLSKEDSKKASLENENIKIVSSSSYKDSITISFAQAVAVPGGNTSSASSNKATTSYSSKIKKATFTEAPASDLLYSPYDVNADLLLEMAKLDPVNKETTKALEIHNMIKGLKSYRENIKNYQRISALHAKSVETLMLSEQCTLEFLGRHYSNPVTVWSGRPLGNQVNEHSLRDGVSGWAIKAFEVAKAENLSPVSADNVVSLVSTNTEGDLVLEGSATGVSDGSNLTDMNKQIASFDMNQSFLQDPSQQEEIEKSAREVSLISWQIGAEAMKKLGLNPGQWKANVSKGFPVWSDQRSMMNQYYDGKYANIEQYIQNLDSQPVINKISRSLSADKSSYDAAEEKRIKAAVENEVLANLQIKASKEESASRFFSSVNKATTDIAAIKAAMVVLIQQARKSIVDLGDQAVVIGGHGQVVLIHTGMVQQIKALSFAVENIARTGTLMNVILADEMLADIDATPDTEYFVGSQGKIRDFRAPFKAPDVSFVPLREVVHYDDVDWDNSKPISKQNFLKYGGEIPSIWKVVLRDKLFVEKDIDLGALLNVDKGTPVETLYRGGRYPCRADGVSGKRLVDIDEDGKYAIRADSTAFAACEFESITKFWKVPRISGGVERHYHVYNSRFDRTFEDVMNLDVIMCNCDPAANLLTSELGVILNASGNNITFRDSISSAFTAIKKAKENTNDRDETFEEKIIADAPLNINQIGDFLKVAETEIDLRKSKDEIAKKIEIAEENLYAIFKLAGFTPSSDFDMAKEEDYNLAKETLLKYKMKTVSEAVKGLGDVKDGGNEVVKERADRYRKIVRALQQDKDALTILGDNVPTQSELAEAIKSEEVNAKVEATYKKDADEEWEKQIKHFYKPYCAAY